MHANQAKSPRSLLRCLEILVKEITVKINRLQNLLTLQQHRFKD